MYAVFDVGGTHIRLALSADGRELTSVVAGLPSRPGAQGVATFVAAMRDLTAGYQLRGVSGCLPGPVNAVGRLVEAVNLPGWTEVDVAAELAVALGVPVRLQHDVTAAAVGEAQRGAGQGYERLAYVTVSTGVNGSLVVAGESQEPPGGFEIGRQLLAQAGDQVLSLERLVGGRSMARREGRSAALVTDAAVWQREAMWLARGLYNTALYWRPDAIVLGGPMMRDIALAEVVQELQRLPLTGARLPALLPASLGDEAGLYGALCLLPV